MGRKFHLALLGLVLLQSPAVAEWEIQRFEGRDYVTLDSIAEFYDLSPPPPLVDPATPAPLAALLLQAPLPLPAIPLVVPGDEITLDSGKFRLSVQLRSREAAINGVRHWLAFPVIVQNGKMLLSRLDMSKVVEPHLRPEKISGLGPVDTVVLDAGHGGHDRGALSRLGFEKDFALDVAVRARVLLEKQGYKVIMTRNSDVFIPLHERAAIANRASKAIFVSIHFNYTATNPSARGFEIYSMAPRGAPATNDAGLNVTALREEAGNTHELPSAALAGSVYASLLGQVPTSDRGLKHARFAVLRLCSIPAVLVECGFVSNREEVAQINSAAWRAKVASAIVDGIDGYKLLAEKHLAPRTVADYRSGLGD